MLAVEGLSVALPGGTAVVDGVNLQVTPGSVVALLGPSGAGKTTLLRAMLDPEGLRGDGFEVDFARRELGVETAFVPQRGALLDHLDVAGNIGLASRPEGRGVDQWLAALGLDAGLASRMPPQLSGGQAQRVSLARALAAGRKLLVLDEPSVGLDPLGVRQLARLLVELARDEQVAILLITHDLTLAVGACDRVLFLDPQRRTLAELLEQEPGELIDDEERKRQRRLLESRSSARWPSPRRRWGRGPRAAGSSGCRVCARWRWRAPR